MRTVAAVLALVACVHAGIWALVRPVGTAPAYTGQVASLSYSPFKDLNPDHGPRPTPEQIRADLAAIAPYTRAIRTYQATGGAELIPPIAAEFGLKVTVGAWIGDDEARNEREIASALSLARHYSNVDAIVVGNETTLRTDIKVDDYIRNELIPTIQRVKRASPVPVTTGELFDTWIDHPELVSSVDFIAAHILPYWMGVDASTAVDHTIASYDMLRRMYPGKRVVIAEFGWPSAGYNYRSAQPGHIEQAVVLRDFVNRAQSYGIDYNIVEAIDQPWKTAEGGVGPYWGIFDASRQAKFPWTGSIADPDYFKRATLAVLFGVLLSLPILAMAGATAVQALLLSVSANAVGAWLSAIVAFWKGHYFVFGAGVALAFGILLLMPLIAIALSRIEEIAAIAFGRPPRRLAHAPPLVPDATAPKVSIHIPAYCEPPEMLNATLDAVSRLDYPNLECVVVINNTPDPALWRPVEDYCRELGERFKFVRIENLTGYKAGALRLALSHTAPDAEIIGIIDADYVLEPDWLKQLVPTFADPRVGFVQSPQDHRDGARSIMHAAMNAEYSGFFDIGMVQRNEFNAVVMHGTMALIRRAALEGAGGWSSQTIVEDTDLGLSLLEQGWIAHYTNRRYGRGLLPDTFQEYKRQRHRWASGGFQLVRKHWRHLLPWAQGLSREQKREYGIGWLNWLGSDSIGVVVALLNIVWAPFVIYSGSGAAVWLSALCRDYAPYLGGYAIPLSHAFQSLASVGAVPDRILTVPIIAAFAVSIAHSVSLYELRVRAPFREIAGAMLSAMSLQWTVARAVGAGLLKERLPFLRTAKGGASGKGGDFPAFAEAVIAVLLLIAALVLVLTNYKQVREINLFAAVMMVQSLPFLAAVALAGIEGTRFNDFAFWHGIEGRIEAAIGAKAADLLPQSQEVISQAIATPAAMSEAPQVSTDNAEAAQ